jgi:TonB-dependent SusC/RagA subfamily outer membrane receptor
MSGTIARHLTISAGVVLLALSYGCRQHPAGAAPTPTTSDSVDVGYGTQAKRNVTGSISQMDSGASRGKALTMADLLSGRDPALEVTRLPDGGLSLRIRGGRSINASNEPLVVIDGIPQRADNAVLQDIDPRDVATISVLKDAGSLAAYGSRGSNGVLLITLKKH